MGKYPIISVARRRLIDQQAHRVLSSFWLNRENIWPTPPDLDGFFPVQVDMLATRQVGLELDEPEVIQSEDVGYEVAGKIDRRLRRITIAQKFRPEYQRFTTAHELGHWFLHPGLVIHRDRPIQGGERSNGKRDSIEQEADLFAAELLMPRKRLMDRFSNAFGSPISGRDRGKLEVLQMHNPHLPLSRLENELRLRSMLIAEAGSFGPHIFPPLNKDFGVSVTAMAIQLEDLGLVI